MAEVPDDCGEVQTVNVDTELLPPIASRDACGDPTLTGNGNPVVPIGIQQAQICGFAAGAQLDVNVVGGTITVDAVQGQVEITNDAGNAIPVTDSTTPVERLVDGDFQDGLGTITIPDGVLSFGVTVLAGGTNPANLANWPTINGPNFVAPVPLRRGQSVSHAADEGHGNTLNGPITVDVPAGAAVNATWVKP